MKRKKIFFLGAMAVIPGLFVLWAVFSRSAFFRAVVTDNAYVQAEITAIAPQVAGYLTEAPAGDNRKVKAGELLFAVDQRAYAARVDQAGANILAAEAAIAHARAAGALQHALVRQAEAQLASAAAVQTHADQEY
ncbi:MAG: biotin/lipoyl-binding protein, partial [Desulfovibrio sp.]|nr:biotin/lipoyl-binding protein [Desulfovibrio sp.]